MCTIYKDDSKCFHERDACYCIDSFEFWREECLEDWLKIIEEE